jgi:hypothetical protein
MKYESVVTTEDGKENNFVYENSYPVGGAHSVLCAVTGIFWGGYCWFYLAMPTTYQQQVVLDDADEYLKKTMAGKKYEENNAKVSRVSFDAGNETASLNNKVKPYFAEPKVP